MPPESVAIVAASAAAVVAEPPVVAKAPDSYVVMLTPEQRVTLYNFTHQEDQKVKNGGTEGRRYRRVQNACGLAVIGRVGRTNNGVAAVYGKDATPSAFSLTIENVEFIVEKYLGADRPDRPTSIEDVLGSFFDAVEEIKAGRYVSPVDAAPVLDEIADAAAWVPPPEVVAKK